MLDLGQEKQVKESGEAGFGSEKDYGKEFHHDVVAEWSKVLSHLWCEPH